MQHTRLALAALALVFACVTTSPSALAAGRLVIVTQNVKVIGNNVTIKSSGGVTTVEQTQSCSTGISGYLFQSVMVFFGGSAYSVTQSTTCP